MTAPERIRAWVVKYYQPEHVEEMVADLIDAATGNRSANQLEQAALAAIFPESNMARKTKAKSEKGSTAAKKAWSTMDKNRAELLLAQLRNIWHELITGRGAVAGAFADELYRLYALRTLNTSNESDGWIYQWGDCQALRAMADEITRQAGKEIPSDLELAARYLK